MMFMMFLWMPFLLILGGIPLLFIFGLSQNQSQDNREVNDAVNDKNPINILKVRYAKGEIDKEEFIEKMSELK